MSEFEREIPLSWTAKQYIYAEDGKLFCRNCETELVNDGEIYFCPKCDMKIRLVWR